MYRLLLFYEMALLTDVDYQQPYNQDEKNNDYPPLLQKERNYHGCYDRGHVNQRDSHLKCHLLQLTEDCFCCFRIVVSEFRRKPKNSEEPVCLRLSQLFAV